MLIFAFGRRCVVHTSRGEGHATKTQQGFTIQNPNAHKHLSDILVGRQLKNASIAGSLPFEIRLYICSPGSRGSTLCLFSRLFLCR